MTGDPIRDHLEDLARSRYSRSAMTNRERLLRSVPGDILAADREAIQEWWKTRQSRADGELRAASSLSQEASHLRSFGRWAMMQGLSGRNPADWIPKIRQKHAAPTQVPETGLWRAMHEAHEDMRRMIALGAMAGLRAAEIAAIQWSDLDQGNGVLWVREGKGGKDRSVPLSAGLLAELGHPGEGPIIGKRMTAKAVSQAIGRYLRSRDVDYTAHKLRARYATRFLAATGDLAAAAEALGHSDLSSIGRYVIASSDTMRRGAEAAGRIG